MVMTKEDRGGMRWEASVATYPWKDNSRVSFERLPSSCLKGNFESHKQEAQRNLSNAQSESFTIQGTTVILLVLRVIQREVVLPFVYPVGAFFPTVACLLPQDFLEQ